MQALSRAIIFARVSSKSQEDEGYSLDSQLKVLRNYCKNKRLTVVKEFRITETASKQQRRKEFQELLFYISKNKIYHFAVEKTDRLTRNYRDAAYLDEWLEKDERRMLHVVKENLQLCSGSRSHAKFLWGFMVAWAKQYTDNLREEAMKGWAEKLAQGWLPASPPVGYMTVTEDGKRIHIPNPDTMYIVRRVFELYLLPDQTIKTLRVEMAKLGLTTRKGRPFSKSQVARILINPFYIGINRFNGKEYPGAQEPILSKELFNAVQRKLHRRGKSKLHKHDAVFKGMVHCIQCGAMITWQLQKQHYYGTCQRRIEECKGRHWPRQDKLEGRLVGMLEEVQDPGGKILKKLKTIIEMGRYPYVGLHREKIIESLNRQLNRLEIMKEKLYDDKLSGEISRQRYQEKNQLLAGQIAQIQDRLFKLYEVQERQKPNTLDPDNKNPIARLYLKSTPNEKRIIMAQLFMPMEYDGKDVLLQLR